MVVRRGKTFLSKEINHEKWKYDHAETFKILQEQK